MTSIAQFFRNNPVVSLLDKVWLDTHWNLMSDNRKVLNSIGMDPFFFFNQQNKQENTQSKVSYVHVLHLFIDLRWARTGW